MYGKTATLLCKVAAFFLGRRVLTTIGLSIYFLIQVEVHLLNHFSFHAHLGG